MTKAQLIKRKAATMTPTCRRQQPRPTLPHRIIEEWLAQYEKTQSRNARADFAALFAPSPIGYQTQNQ